MRPGGGLQTIEEDISLSRIDRTAFYQAIKFLIGAYPTQNEMMRKMENIISLPNDKYHLPFSLLEKFTSGSAFDEGGNLILYNKGERYQNEMVYSTGQDKTIPDWLRRRT